MIMTDKQLKDCRKMCDDHEMIPSGYFLNLLEHINELKKRLDDKAKAGKE